MLHRWGRLYLSPKSFHIQRYPNLFRSSTKNHVVRFLIDTNVPRNERVGLERFAHGRQTVPGCGAGSSMSTVTDSTLLSSTDMQLQYLRTPERVSSLISVIWLYLFHISTFRYTWMRCRDIIASEPSVLKIRME